MPSTKTLHFSSPFVIYFSAILIIGIICLYHKIFIRRTKNPLLAPPWESSWLNFVILLWILFCIFFIVPIILNRIPTTLFSPPLSDDLKTVIIGFTTHALLAFAFLYLMYKHHALLGGLIQTPTNSPYQAVLAGIYHFFTAIPIVWTLNIFWYHFLLFLVSKGISIEFKRQFLVDLFAYSKNPIFIITVTFFSVIVAPFTEEMIFRVSLFRFLKTKLSQISALTITSTFFAILHFHFLAVLPLFILGILLARSYEATGHPLTPITFHACFNLNTLAILFLQPNLTYF